MTDFFIVNNGPSQLFYFVHVRAMIFPPSQSDSSVTLIRGQGWTLRNRGSLEDILSPYKVLQTNNDVTKSSYVICPKGLVLAQQEGILDNITSCVIRDEAGGLVIPK